MPGELDWLTKDAPAGAAPMPQAAAPQQDHSMDWLTQDTPQPQETPATQETPSHGWGDIIPSFMSGAKRGFGEAMQTVTGEDRPEQEQIPADEPFHLSDIWHPATGLTKMAGKIGASGPTTAGGVMGATAGSPLGPVGQVGVGALGAAAGAALQTFGPALQRELKASPDDPEGAWQRARNSTLMAGGASGLSWGLFPARILNGPIKNFMFQALGVQPGIAVAHQAGENIQHGNPPLEGAGEAYTEGAAGTLPTAAGRVVSRFLGKGDQSAQAVAKKTIAGRTAQDLLDVANDHYGDIDEWQKAGGLDYTNKPELEGVGKEITTRLKDAGGDPRYGPLGKDIFGIVDDIQDAKSFKDINATRKMLNGYLSSNEPNVRRLAREAISGLDEWLHNPDRQTDAGVDPRLADQLADKLKIANSYWKAGKGMEAWDKVQDRIDNAPNHEARRRSEITRIVNNPKLHWQYPPEAIDMMKASLKDPSMFMSAMRTITKPFDPHSAMGIMADVLMHHFTGPMGLAAPLISALTRRAVQKPLEATTHGVPHYIRHAPEIGRTLGSMPRYKGRDVIPESPGYGPMMQPQPQMQEGGEVPIGDFDEALDPQPQLLPNYPRSAPEPGDFGPPSPGASPLSAPRVEPSMGDFMEALNPKPDLIGGAYGSPDPELMNAAPTPRPDIQTTPMPQPRPPVPLAAPGMGKGAPAPYAAPGVGGKGAAPTALRIARRQHRRHYEEGGSDDSGPDIPEAEQAQQARDVAAQRMQSAVGPSPTQPQDVPERFQSWGNYLQPVKQAAMDTLQHPENIVGTGELGPAAGMFLPASRPMAQSAEAGLRSGMSRESLWDLIGAFKDTGGDWRTEVMGPTKLQVDPYSPFKGTLGQAYDNPAFYKRMPEMADTPFTLKHALDPYDTTLGTYFPAYGSQPAQIEARTLRRGDEMPDQLLGTLAHETQHGVDQAVGLQRMMPGNRTWFDQGKKGNTSTPEWNHYVDELANFYKGDRDKASVSAEMGTVPEDWHKAAANAVNFRRYWNSIDEVMARLTDRREKQYNLMEAMYGPKGAQREMKGALPFGANPVSGYDVPEALQMLGKKQGKPRKSKGGAAKKALALARR